MKQMNFKTMLIALLAAVVLFSSCKKDNPVLPEPIPVSLTGEWEGSFTNGDKPETSYFNYKVNKDGTFNTKTVKNGAYTGNGTWTQTGDVFKATYSYSEAGIKYFISAKINAVGDNMKGTYSSALEDNIKGNVVMIKK